MNEKLGTVFTDIATAIRGKTGGTATMLPTEMPVQINSISVGSSDLGTIATTLSPPNSGVVITPVQCTNGTSVLLAAEDKGQYTFSYWEYEDGTTTTENPLKVAVQGQKNLICYFLIKGYQFTYGDDGGMANEVGDAFFVPDGKSQFTYTPFGGTYTTRTLPFTFNCYEDMMFFAYQYLIAIDNHERSDIELYYSVNKGSSWTKMILSSYEGDRMVEFDKIGVVGNGLIVLYNYQQIKILSKIDMSSRTYYNRNNTLGTVSYIAFADEYFYIFYENKSVRTKDFETIEEIPDFTISTFGSVSLAYNKNVHKYLVCTSDDGLVGVSTDGLHWEKPADGLIPVPPKYLIVTMGNNFLLCGQNGGWISENGVDWIKVTDSVGVYNIITKRGEEYILTSDSLSSCHKVTRVSS